MSDDEDFDMPSDDDYDDGQYFQQANPVPQRAAPIVVPPPQQFQGQGQIQVPGGRYMNPAMFQAGFGGHAFARPPASAFRRQYRAYSTAILEIQQGRGHLTGGRANVMYGGKIIMPPSALDELTQLDIELPITFELKNPSLPDISTHVGVLEFIAEEGQVNLPQWVMDQLRLNEGDPIRIWGARMPKGKMVKIQPQTVDFLELSDPKAVLEQAFRNYSCLTAGDIIEISYQTLNFRILIMEITPPGPGISCIDTDLEVDFAAPLGYVEPERVPRAAAPTMKDKFIIDTTRKQEVDSKGSGTSTPVPGSGEAALAAWEAFKGSGASLGGKRVKGKGIKAKKAEAVDPDSKIIRTDQTRIITSDVQIGGRQVPGPLNLPFGNLFFGFENMRPAPGSSADLALTAEAAAPIPFAGVGNGATLSGRIRTPNSAAATPPPPPTTTSAERTVSFQGQGQSVSGRKEMETIVID